MQIILLLATKFYQIRFTEKKKVKISSTYPRVEHEFNPGEELTLYVLYLKPLPLSKPPIGNWRRIQFP